jgi:hypothetical protein
MEVGQHHPAAWMVRLVIAQFETELRWLGHVSHELAMKAFGVR